MGEKGNLGNVAINGLALPGVFISSNSFDSQTEKFLHDLNIKHEVVDASEFLRSGGSVHCLTNELNLSDKL